MRMVAFFLMIVCLATLTGCALSDMLFWALGDKHYTDGTTHDDRYARFQKQYDEQTKTAENYQREK